MRPSLRKSHFMACPHCDGHGEIKSPDIVGADATRQAGYLLQFDRVRRLEMVCSPRVASVLLSGKRRELVKLEDESGKKIDVRVSDAIALDRVDFYAYDERNADIDVSKLPSPKTPTIGGLEAAERAPAADKPAAPARKRRRRRKTAVADATTMALATPVEAEAPAEPVAREAPAEPAAREVPAPAAEEAPAPAARTGRSRRRRRKPAHAGASAPPEKAAAPPQEAAATDEDATEKDGMIRIHRLARELGVPSRDVKSHMSSVTRRAADLLRRFFGSPAPKKRRSGRRTAGELKPTRAPEARSPQAKAPQAKAPQAKAPQTKAPEAETRPAEAPARKKRSRRSRGRRAPEAAAATTPVASGAGSGAAAADSKPKRRSSSGRGRKKKRQTQPATAAAPKTARNGPRGEAPGLDDTAVAGDKAEPAAAAKSRLYRSRRRLTRTAARQLLEEKADE
jgi:hypothetical protein